MAPGQRKKKQKSMQQMENVSGKKISKLQDTLNSNSEVLPKCKKLVGIFKKKEGTLLESSIQTKEPIANVPKGVKRKLQKPEFGEKKQKSLTSLELVQAEDVGLVQIQTERRKKKGNPSPKSPVIASGSNEPKSKQGKMKYEKLTSKKAGILPKKKAKVLALKAKRKDLQQNDISPKTEKQTPGNDGEAQKGKSFELPKKERKKLRKALRSNHELSDKAKKLWEMIRREKCPEGQRLQFCKELHNLIKGNVSKLIYAHDTVRVVECLMQYAKDEVRQSLFEELKGEILQLCKSKYAKFFVKKILMYGTKEQRNLVISSFYGNMSKLITHAEASGVVEFAYNDWANATQRSSLVQEFYGPMHSVFKDKEINSLSDLLTREPGTKPAIISHMKEKLFQMIQKSLMHLSLAHHILLEFLIHCDDKSKSEMIEAVRDKVVEMLHTRDGSRAGMHCIWYGTAKDRKTIIRSMKTHVLKICKEEHGHMVLMSIFEFVDDTRLVHKALLEEMMRNSKEVAFDVYGRKVLFHLLSPRNKIYFHPDIVNILAQGDNSATSKKSKEVRHKELVEAVSPLLFELLANNTREMLFSAPASKVAQAICQHCIGDHTEVYEKIADIVAEPFIPGSVDNVHIVEIPHGHMFLKQLLNLKVIADGENKDAMKNDPELFCTILLKTVPEEFYEDWIGCNRGAFILVSMLSSGGATVEEKLKQILEPLHKKLQKKKCKGAEILFTKLKAS